MPRLSIGDLPQHKTGCRPHDKRSRTFHHVWLTVGPAITRPRRHAGDAFAERRLVAAAQAGDEGARADLLEACRSSISAIARHYNTRHAIDRAELMQEGAVGVLRALERYDPDRGTPFWGYASWWVRQAMQCLVSELRHPVVLSDRAVRKLVCVKDAKRRHIQTHHRAPSRRELAEMTGLGLQHVERLEAVERAPRSLAELVGTDGDSSTTLMDQLADTAGDTAEQHVDRCEDISTARDLDADLTGRERYVLRARFGFDGVPQTLRQVAEHLDVSTERVRQIESAALEALRAAIERRSGGNGTRLR
jgi:RNA polymerase primary sigma factor